MESASGHRGDSVSPAPQQRDAASEIGVGNVTLRTVAEAAGVSVTTVSRVLNGNASRISIETREHTLAMARRLGYRPNRLGVDLRKGVTHSAGLVIPDLGNSYFQAVVRGVEDVAREAGYSVILCNTDRDPLRERRYVDLLLEKHVDILIFAGAGVNDDEHLRDCVWGDTRVITIGPHSLACPSVNWDQRAFTREAVAHLVDQGCSRVACLSGQRSWLTTQVRLAGYRDALKDAGFVANPQLIWPSDFTVSAGERAVGLALRAGRSFDGIVSFSDYAAIGALRALKDAGLAVPRDVAIIGCDDIEMVSYVEPPLSSIRLPAYDASRAAMRLALDMASLKGGSKLDSVEFGFELRVRASSRRKAEL